MSARSISRAVQCPACGTWVEDAWLCSWCTVELATGSWQHADMTKALRALRRMQPSVHEVGPTPWYQLIEDDSRCGTDRGYRVHRSLGEAPCDACVLAHTVKNREWKRASRARQVAA